MFSRQRVGRAGLHGVTMEIDTSGLDRDVLTPAVRRACASEAAIPRTWQIAPVRYANLASETRGVFRVAGTADDRGAERPWSAVLKAMRAPGDAGDQAGHPYWWRREASLYRSGLLPRTGGFVAARCYGVQERPDGALWLWLEDLGEEETIWPLDRYRLAAEHLGRFQGERSWAAGHPAPAVLSRGLLRTWVEDSAYLIPPLRRPEVWAHPLLRRAFPSSPAGAVLALWDERERWFRAIERTPRVFCHHDVWRRNLFSRRDTAGGERTVAIDWELAGIGAAGEDAGNLLGTSLLDLAVAADQAAALRDRIVDGYLAGLRGGGWSGDAGEVRAVLLATAVFRSLFSTAGWPVAIALDGSGRHAAQTERQWGRPLDAILRHWAAVTAFLLDAAGEARVLLDRA